MKTRRRYKGGFPKKEGVDYSKLKITAEGMYSRTKRKEGEELIMHMKSLVKDIKKKHITDLTANVGGDTILFGMHFKKVDAIEINPDNFAALKENVSVYNLKNVTLHQGDSTKIYNWKSDVVYIDAPWGGPSYKEKKELDLFVGDVRIDEFIEDLFKKENAPEYIFIKVPFNYHFERLKELQVKEIHKFKIRNYYLIGLKL